jgi:nitronate monooxygenase
VIGSPLFIISVPDLVIAQCTAGVVGSFPALNARPASLLDEWIARIKEELAAWDKAHPDRLSAPFAVNQIVHKSNDRLDHDMAMAVKYKVPVIISSLGARRVNDAMVRRHCLPRRHQPEIRPQGGRRAPTASSWSRPAPACAGTISPLAFVGNPRRYDGPIAVGAIANRAIRAARAARGRLRLYRQRLHRDASQRNPSLQGDDYLLGGRHRLFNLFTGVHGNYLKPSIVKAGLNLTTCRPQIPPR